MHPGHEPESVDAVASSYQFHREIESPLAFFRREWRAIALFGGVFSALMIAVIFLIDQSFFYPRLETDALLYFLKAKSLADSGTTAARLAINLSPYPYASMPGVLRTPFLLLFSDFDQQLRAIQLTSLLMIDVIALLSAYVLSWVLPRSRHWMAIGFAFGFVLLSPWWIANIFLPLADAPYAVFSLLSMIIAIRAVASPRPLGRAGQLIVFGLVFVIAFLTRYTQPVVLILIAVLLRGRFRGERILWKKAALNICLVLVAIAVLVYANREAIVGRYLAEPIGLFMRGDKQSIILNLIVNAIPSQIVPGFALGFSHPPIVDLYHAEFAVTKRDMLWSAVGVLLSGIVAVGAWRSRARMLPELMMVVAVMPVLVVMMPSTSRYFMTYQPFFWITFYLGLRTLSGRVPATSRSYLVSHGGLLAAIALLIGLTLALEGRHNSGDASGRRNPTTLASMQYVRGVTGTYRPLRQFLQTLPPDRAILTSTRYSFGRWKAIANLDSYAPDSGLVALTRRKDVYMVVDCGSVDLCSWFPAREASMKDFLCQVGEFDYELVFAAKDSKSEAKVFRVRAAL